MNIFMQGYHQLYNEYIHAGLSPTLMNIFMQGYHQLFNEYIHAGLSQTF